MILLEEVKKHIITIAEEVQEENGYYSGRDYWNSLNFFVDNIEEDDEIFNHFDLDYFDEDNQKELASFVYNRLMRDWRD